MKLSVKNKKENGGKYEFINMSDIEFKNSNNEYVDERLSLITIPIKPFSTKSEDLKQLFKRMVFNLVFRNVDDHFKNHSFIYNKESNSWNLGPAYDLTYALNPQFTFKTTSRALSINGKRTSLKIKDVLTIAEEFSIKNPKGIIEDVQALIPRWLALATELDIPENIIKAIQKEIKEIE